VAKGAALELGVGVGLTTEVVIEVVSEQRSMQCKQITNNLL
jgi:F0F1-type ATP synthase membrane subunit c/vacuolar-type H+-ATPase subunit K